MSNFPGDRPGYVPGTIVPIQWAIERANARPAPYQLYGAGTGKRRQRPTEEELSELSERVRGMAQSPIGYPELTWRRTLDAVQTLENLPDAKADFWFEDLEFCAALGRICYQTRQHDSELAMVWWSRHVARFSGKVSFTLDGVEPLGTPLWHLPMAERSRPAAVTSSGTVYEMQWMSSEQGQWGVRYAATTNGQHADVVASRPSQVPSIGRLSYEPHWFLENAIHVRQVNRQFDVVVGKLKLR